MRPLGTIFNQNITIFMEKNEFEIVVGKMARVLSWPQCVDVMWLQCRPFVEGYSAGLILRLMGIAVYVGT